MDTTDDLFALRQSALREHTASFSFFDTCRHQLYCLQNFGAIAK